MLLQPGAALEKGTLAIQGVALWPLSCKTLVPGRCVEGSVKPSAASPGYAPCPVTGEETEAQRLYVPISQGHFSSMGYRWLISAIVIWAQVTLGVPGTVAYPACFCLTCHVLLHRELPMDWGP